MAHRGSTPGSQLLRSVALVRPFAWTHPPSTRGTGRRSCCVGSRRESLYQDIIVHCRTFPLWLRIIWVSGYRASLGFQVPDRPSAGDRRSSITGPGPLRAWVRFGVAISMAVAVSVRDQVAASCLKAARGSGRRTRWRVQQGDVPARQCLALCQPPAGTSTAVAVMAHRAVQPNAGFFARRNRNLKQILAAVPLLAGFARGGCQPRWAAHLLIWGEKDVHSGRGIHFPTTSCGAAQHQHFIQRRPRPGATIIELS